MERLRLTSIVKGTKAELTTDTEIRANSIMFSEIDSRKVKFADGVHTYADLPYVTGALDEGDGTVYRFKGSVDKYSDLPTENNRAGDTYDVREYGKNYTWTADGAWDDIGGTIDLSNYATKDDLDTETGKIYEAMASESEIRQEAEGDLQNNIDTVAGNLQDEVDNRTNAISDLTDALRQTDNDLEAETTARQEADNTLTDTVSVIQNNISVLDGEITDESNRAKEAETGLANNKADKSDTLSGYGITDAYTKSECDELFLKEHQDISGKQDIITDLDDIRSGATAGSTAVQPDVMAAQIATLTQQINELKLSIPKEAFTADEVRSMTKQSGKVTLCSDVDLGVVSLVDGTFANNKTTINLNGHTLSANPTGGRALLQLRGTSQYTFNGDGYVDDWSDDSSCVWSRTENNVLTINGGTWIAHGHTETIYCEKGTIYINGGIFKTDMEDKRYVLNCLDANFKAGTAKIIVKGGEFWDFDPSANPEGEGTTYVAEGYTVTSREEDGHTIYKVVKA